MLSLEDQIIDLDIIDAYSDFIFNSSVIVILNRISPTYVLTL